LDELLLVVNLVVEIVEVLDQVAAAEGIIWLHEIGVLSLDLCVKFVPLLVQHLAIVFVLLDGVLLLLLRVHLESLVEGEWIDLLQNGLESNKRFLENLVPVVFGEVNDDWHKHGEGLVLVSLQDIKEIVVLEEAHCSVGNLKVDTANAFDDSLEELVDHVANLLDFTHFEDLLQLGQEKSLLDAVGEGPVFEQTFEKRNGKSTVFCEEEHGTSEELFVELGASLNLVERNDDILEENNVLITERYSET
jgi:hypothetical protein